MIILASMQNSGTLKVDLFHCPTGGYCLPGSNTTRTNFEKRFETFYAGLFETLARMLRLKDVFLLSWTSYPVIAS